MKLLDFKQVKAEKTKKDEEEKKNIERLRKEEIRLINSINSLSEKEKKEKIRAKEELQVMAGNLETKKIELNFDIKNLKKQKEIEMRPVAELKKEAENLLIKILKRENKIQERENKAYETEKRVNLKIEDISERLEELIDREKEIENKENDINNRLIGIKKEEEKIKESLHNLSKKWSEFHQRVLIINSSFEIREKEIESGQKINESINLEFEKERIRLRKEDLAIKDKYKELEKSIEIFNKNKNGKCG